tara:strand:- start:1277 stop:1816 length:540 start_codon:yes stop_codon:yes gene_type:complete
MYLTKTIYSEDYNICDSLDKNNSSYIYGEVDYEHFINILKKLNLIIENYEFLDVGSGNGKLCIYVSNYYKINSVGIEIDTMRYKNSIELLENTDLYEYVEFINCCFKNHFFGNFNLLYCCNVVFEENENKLLYSKILNEFNGIFILFEYDNSLLPYLYKREIINTSWQKNVMIYIFKKN